MMASKKGSKLTEEHKKAISASLAVRYKRPEVSTKDLYKQYKAGKSMREISKEVRMSHQAIYLRFVGAGLPTRSRSDAIRATCSDPDIRKKIVATIKRNWDERLKVPKEEMCKQYVSGMTMAAVAELAGVGIGHTRRVLCDGGVAIRGKKDFVVSAETRAKISAAKMGKKRGPMPKEWRDKIGAKARERYADPEYRKKWHEARYGKGREASDE